jgi:hypothetical protein
MLKSAMGAWSEIVEGCQVRHAGTPQKTLIFFAFSLAPRRGWILIRVKSRDFSDLITNNNQQQ